MRKIIFYRLENGECPVQNYLDSLSNKQVEKVFFVLDLIENCDIVLLELLDIYINLPVGSATIPVGYVPVPNAEVIEVSDPVV